MAEPFHFEKSKAEYFLRQLAAGAPIEGVATHNEILALAGACVFVAMSHGPASHQRDDPATVLKEHQEMTSAQHSAEIMATVEVYSGLTMAVQDGGYDAKYAPVLRGILRVEGDGQRIVQAIEGFKKLD